jgi:cytochrome c oxidase subunit IV
MSEEFIPRSTYINVFIALVVLAAATALVSHLNLGFFNGAISLVTAFCKAALVALFFMHVRQSRHLVWLFVFGSLVWLSILLLTLADYLTRSWTVPPRGL